VRLFFWFEFRSLFESSEQTKVLWNVLANTKEESKTNIKEKLAAKRE